MLTFTQLVFVLFLVVINGFFVAAEYSLVSMRKTRIDELVKKGNRKAFYAQKAMNQLNTYLSAIQWGVTLANIAIGWIGAPVIASLLFPLFVSFLPQGISLYTAQVFSVALAFIFITTLQIILGESVPKAIALQNTESTLLDVIPYLTIFVNIFNPFIWLLNVVCNFVLRSFGLSNFTKQELTHSEEEIKMILEHSSQKGIFKKHEIEMVYNIFKMGDSSVKDIMVPRTEIIGFNINTTLADIAKRIEKNLHSRFPVYRYSVDNIIGFIHIKDFYRSLLTSNQKTKLRETNLVRKIISIPENIKIDELLYLMRKQWIHIAVVHNEYSETCGIVSLEDVLEAVTGDIQDEFDDHIKEIQKESPGTYLIQSHTSLDRIRNKFKIKLENENFNTVGGLVLAKIRKKPKKGDKITVDSISLEVIEVRKRKIKTIRLKTRGITHHSIKAQTKSHAIIN